jgi:hypothetical protein
MPRWSCRSAFTLAAVRVRRRRRREEEEEEGERT